MDQCGQVEDTGELQILIGEESKGQAAARLKPLFIRLALTPFLSEQDEEIISNKMIIIMVILMAQLHGNPVFLIIHRFQFWPQ
jgi:hypothetical protein